MSEVHVGVREERMGLGRWAWGPGPIGRHHGRLQDLERKFADPQPLRVPLRGRSGPIIESRIVPRFMATNPSQQVVPGQVMPEVPRGYSVESGDPLSPAGPARLQGLHHGDSDFSLGGRWWWGSGPVRGDDRARPSGVDHTQLSPLGEHGQPAQRATSDHKLGRVQEQGVEEQFPIERCRPSSSQPHRCGERLPLARCREEEDQYRFSVEEQSAERVPAPGPGRAITRDSALFGDSSQVG